ncbi:hypothetical protein J5226_17785 [Lysobacter sp. K5869]|uniref:hypothetical protein n=1 Tax=Lysobacter sp. K5869 TaxID=2820808 RepID=UPI001C0643B4|nr:hypothetical protein [Lysobacter sp. K5869]QWP75454.1 hypothetical protein J5226_17785 [Lysobacter sp. K5869]
MRGLVAASTASVLCAAALLTGGCDRHPPADVSPPAASAARTIADVNFLKPADIAIEYKDQVARFARGKTVRYSIVVINNSGYALQTAGEHRAFIAYRWYLQGGQGQPVENPHAPLRTPVAAGESAIQEFEVVAPAQPGSYTLKVFMGVDGGPDFESGGQAPLHYNVTID